MTGDAGVRGGAGECSVLAVTGVPGPGWGPEPSGRPGSGGGLVLGRRLARRAAALLLQAPEEVRVVIGRDGARTTGGRAKGAAAGRLRGRRSGARRAAAAARGAADRDPHDRSEHRQQDDDRDPERSAEAGSFLGQAPREVDQGEDRQRDRYHVDEGAEHPSRVSRAAA